MTFLRIGVPCSLRAKSFEYEAPAGWRIVHVRRLDCGWFSIILQKRRWYWVRRAWALFGELPKLEEWWEGQEEEA